MVKGDTFSLVTKISKANVTGKCGKMAKNSKNANGDETTNDDETVNEMDEYVDYNSDMFGEVQCYTSYRKTILDEPLDSVKLMLSGLKVSYPGLYVDVNAQIILLLKSRQHRVALLSGSASGHDPFPAGYVGEKMLTGAVVGQVFASPPSGNILAAIEALTDFNKGGTIVFVPNYTGEVINFGLAVESAIQRGVPVEMFVFGDDSALLEEDYGLIVGRRALCGIIFAIKIAGAMSFIGRKLSDIILELRSVTIRIGSMGVCLNSCTVPYSSEPLFNLKNDEMGIGIGIRGEPGIQDVKLSGIRKIVKRILDTIFRNLVAHCGDNLCVMVSGLGGATLLEILAMAGEVEKQICKMGFVIGRMYTGSLMTSLDTNGLVVSVLNVTGKEVWIKYLDMETDAFAWPGNNFSSQEMSEYTLRQNVPRKTVVGQQLKLKSEERLVFLKCISNICDAFIREEHYLNQLDSGFGEGNCGTTFAQFAHDMKENLNKIPMRNVGKTFLYLSEIVERSMGGISGAIYSLLFLGAAIGANSWHEVVFNATELVQKYISAKVGHRTMMDVLIPVGNFFIKATSSSGTGRANCSYILRTAVYEANSRVEGTALMVPKAGQGGYVQKSRIHGEDAGAYAASVWLKSLSETLRQNPDS